MTNAGSLQLSRTMIIKKMDKEERIQSILDTVETEISPWVEEEATI